jgi:ABC-type transport system substrate-binding protein
MKSATAKKLLKEAGFEYSNQQRIHNGLSNGKVYFLGEKKYDKNRAFFKVVGKDDKGILETLENFLQVKGYETQINKSEWSVSLQILNPNREKGKDA